MAEKKPQTRENHGKLVAGFHFVAVPLLLVYLLWSAWHMITDFSVHSAMNLILAVAVFIIGFYSRTFPLQAQDRVIRLEEKLRLHGVLPADLRERIDEIPSTLFVALRFAPDEELPGLVQRILAGDLRSRKAVKQEIQQWRPDYYRL